MAGTKLLKIRNATKGGAILADRAQRASSFVDRFVGLMGRKVFPVGEGLIIEPCTGIHTFFMRLPIDAVFYDAVRKVVACYPALAPWRVSGVFPSARAVLELPAGVLAASGTQVGDVIEIDEMTS